MKVFYLKIVLTIEYKVVLGYNKRKKCCYSFIATIVLLCFSKDSFTAYILSVFGRLAYKDLKARDTK